MVSLKALLICENLIDLITREEILQGQVHSVFNNACNIETKHNLITLLCKDKIMAPMSAIVDTGERVNFKDLKVTQNSKFYISVIGFYCKEKNIFISLCGAKKWFPGVEVKSFNCSENLILENIKTMELGLSSKGKLYGIGPLISMLSHELPGLGLLPFQTYSTDKSYEFIKYRFINFIKSNS